MATFPTPESRYTPPPVVNKILLAEELAEIADRAQSFTSATGVIIALRRGNELVVRTSAAMAPEVGACIPLPSGVTGLCVTTKKPQTSASADAEAQLESVFRAIGVRSVLSVPVQWDGEVRGVLAVLSQTPDAFSRTHSAILMTLRDVIANKLSQCELPSDAPRQAAPGPAPAVEISVESLLKLPSPTPEASRPPVPVRPKANPVPVKPATLSPSRVEPAPAAPALNAEPKLPLAMPSPPPAKPLAELLKEKPEEPVGMSPDVLCPGDDPAKYGSLPKPKPKPAAYTPPPVDFSSTMFATYHPPAKRRHSNFLVFAGSAAAIILLGLAIAFYALHKPAVAASTSVVAQQAPTAAPAPSLIAVPLPKSFGEQPPPAELPKPAASPIVAKHEELKQAPQPKEEVKRTAQPKAEAEETAHKPLPIVHLASLKPVAKPEEPIEPPAVGAVGVSAKALPALPTAHLPSVSLAARQSALVPAHLLQGKPPQYPQAARPLRLSGTVKLQISISAEGKVTDIRVLSGTPILNEASISAVRNWVYRPAYLDGSPVDSVAEVSLRFTPNRQP